MNININRNTEHVVRNASLMTYPIVVPDTFTLSKMIQVQNGVAQKLDDNGQPLYNTDIGEETTEPNDNPIMVPVMMDKYVTLNDVPEEFTVDDIVNKKYTDALSNSGRKYIIADEFLTEDDIDLSKPKLVNTGIKVFQLLPHGEATSKVIPLEKSTKHLYLVSFEADTGVVLEVNGKQGVDGVYTFDTAIDQITFKIINSNDGYANASAYAICYDEEV